jgi:hypothetical protein
VSVLVLLIFVLVVKYRNKREKFSDFDDILDAKCSSISSGEEYIWDEKTCGPNTCDSEECQVLIKNVDNNAYTFRTRPLNKKKVMVNNKIDVFKCISNHSPESNIYCHPNEPPTCYEETRDCFLWDDNTSQWNKNIYQKIINSGGECKWYNQTYPTGSGVELLPRECRPDILDCSACNLKCNHHNNEYETWRYDKINDSCYKHNECQTCDNDNSDNQEEGYFFNYAENRYDKVVFLQNEVDCSYSYFDGSTEYCHPMHTTGSMFQCEHAGRDVLDNNGKYNNTQFETRNCSNDLPNKTCFELDYEDQDRETQILISKKYKPVLAHDRTKCVYVSENDENVVKEMNGQTFCDGIGMCKNIDEYVDCAKRKCVKCPEGKYLEDRLATTYETACKPIPEITTPPDECWEPDPSNTMIDRIKAYPYVNVPIYNQDITQFSTIRSTSTAPPDCELYNDDESGFDNLGNRIRDRCPYSGVSTCEDCKYEMSNCRFNPDTGFCGCEEEKCDSGIYKCLDNINGNEFRDYKLHQEDPFSPCILKSDYGITMEQQECISECPISKSKFKSKDGKTCIIPDCVVETKYYFNRFDEYINFPFHTSVFRLSKTNEEYFEDFLEEDTAITLMCDIEELTKVVYLKKKSEDPNSDSESREKYKDQTKCVYGNAVYPSSSSPQDLNSVNTEFNSEVGFILEQTSKKRPKKLCPQDCVVDIERTPINQLCKNVGNFSLDDGTRCIKDPNIYGEYNLQDEVAFEIKQPSISTGKSCIQAAEDYFQNYLPIRSQSVDGLEQGQLVRFQVECEDVKECPQDCVEEWSCGACGYSSYNPFRICDQTIITHPKEGGKLCSEISSKKEYCDPPPEAQPRPAPVDDSYDPNDGGTGEDGENGGTGEDGESVSLPTCSTENTDHYDIVYRDPSDPKITHTSMETLYASDSALTGYCDDLHRTHLDSLGLDQNTDIFKTIGKYYQWKEGVCKTNDQYDNVQLKDDDDQTVGTLDTSSVKCYTEKLCPQFGYVYSASPVFGTIYTHDDDIIKKYTISSSGSTNTATVSQNTLQEEQMITDFDNGVDLVDENCPDSSDSTNVIVRKYKQWIKQVSDDCAFNDDTDNTYQYEFSYNNGDTVKLELDDEKCVSVEPIGQCTASEDFVYIIDNEDTIIYTSNEKYTIAAESGTLATKGTPSQQETNIITNFVNGVDGTCPDPYDSTKVVVRKYKQWIKQASDNCDFSAGQTYEHTFSDLYVAGDTVKLELVEEKCVNTQVCSDDESAHFDVVYGIYDAQTEDIDEVTWTPTTPNYEEMIAINKNYDDDSISLTTPCPPNYIAVSKYNKYKEENCTLPAGFASGYKSIEDKCVSTDINIVPFQDIFIKPNYPQLPPEQKYNQYGQVEVQINITNQELKNYPKELFENQNWSLRFWLEGYTNENIFTRFNASWELRGYDSVDESYYWEVLSNKIYEHQFTQKLDQIDDFGINLSYRHYNNNTGLLDKGGLNLDANMDLYIEVYDNNNGKSIAITSKSLHNFHIMNPDMLPKISHVCNDDETTTFTLTFFGSDADSSIRTLTWQDLPTDLDPKWPVWLYAGSGNIITNTPREDLGVIFRQSSEYDWRGYLNGPTYMVEVSLENDKKIKIKNLRTEFIEDTGTFVRPEWYRYRIFGKSEGNGQYNPFVVDDDSFYLQFIDQWQSIKSFKIQFEVLKSDLYDDYDTETYIKFEIKKDDFDGLTYKQVLDDNKPASIRQLIPRDSIVPFRYTEKCDPLTGAFTGQDYWININILHYNSNFRMFDDTTQPRDLRWDNAPPQFHVFQNQLLRLQFLFNSINKHWPYFNKDIHFIGISINGEGGRRKNKPSWDDPQITDKELKIIETLYDGSDGMFDIKQSALSSDKKTAYFQPRHHTCHFTLDIYDIELGQNMNTNNVKIKIAKYEKEGGQFVKIQEGCPEELEFNIKGHNMCMYPRIKIDRLLCVANKDIQTRQNELRGYIDVDSGSSDKWSWGPSIGTSTYGLQCTPNR